MTEAAERDHGRTVAITGATGMIGSELVRSLRAAGHRVKRIVRSDPGADDVLWSPDEGTIEKDKLLDVDVVVHLAGESLDKRWTDERRRRIMESRRLGTELIASTLAGMERGPRALVCSAGVGYYGDRGDEVLTEQSSQGDGFLAEVVRVWEASAQPARDAGLRVVHLRLGVVLSASGGALAKMLPPFKMGVGGALGDGRQWMSWISLEDAIRAFHRAIDDDSMTGTYNVTSPQPVRNEEFVRALGRVINRPTLLRVPELALQVMFGEMANETVLVSQRAIPERLEAAGFEFRHRDVEAGLRAALDASGRSG